MSMNSHGGNTGQPGAYIGANGNVRGKKEFEPSSQAAESEPLLGPHREGYWPHGGLLGPLWRTIHSHNDRGGHGGG